MATNYVSVNLEALGYTGIALKRMEKEFMRHGTSVVAGIAGEARSIAYPNFFKHHPPTGLTYNTPDRARSGKGPLQWRGNQGYVDSMGRRLVNFSLESKRPSRKTAYISSYPMNLWEHDTKDGRAGLFIMSVKLPPLVEGIVPKHVQKAEQDMKAKGDAELEGALNGR